MVKEANSKRRYYEVGQQIEELLVTGVFKPGERLPSERSLSEQFNTSRATIREAIIMLELKDLVDVRQGAGIFFREKDSDNDDTVSDQLIQEVGVFELLQARMVLETSIIEFAARNIKLNELRELKKIILQQEEFIDDNEKFEELDREFHLFIAKSTQNRMMIDTANRLWNRVRTDSELWAKLNVKYLHDDELKRSWLDEHKKIYYALQKRDEILAKETMLSHLDHSKGELLKLVDSEDESLLEDDDMFFVEAE
ncbi:FadR/GntR family transcriptional regulator [Vibrio breoganii]|uniref:FadR family transcriptional regulator n=1 Tax=Vibrio breoganii TaxID=553239 RepID=A0ABX1U4K3_9VIBR|nr:FadR/GntR family transcriptional regulator [Vibrio breoganii]NMO73100.1 FadR family transcriptional regulator [Vibrio breoganii]NMR69387.1 FadR family transcriptional regulator [Vibrio breoganii]PMG98486.1 GntR family transcriptional regulator [Vibrio breoganii]PMJ46670.1 GntR family transcriptional regulator [Vibrio breoganii]PMK60504.1 GntR family transcriptional regulator [Vibrio breoganii]